MAILIFEGLVQQVSCLLVACELGGSGREDHEGVGVALLACARRRIGVFVMGVEGGKPAAELIIMERTPQGSKPVTN